jgi:selenide,water dikinase
VTGFGLIGHGCELAGASGCTLAIDVAAVPLLEGALALAGGNVPGGGRSNAAHFGPEVATVGAIDDDLRTLLYDPQTSGGLLVSVAAAALSEVQARLAEGGVDARVIGEVLPPAAERIRLR